MASPPPSQAACPLVLFPPWFFFFREIPGASCPRPPFLTFLFDFVAVPDGPDCREKVVIARFFFFLVNLFKFLFLTVRTDPCRVRHLLTLFLYFYALVDVFFQALVPPIPFFFHLDA